MRRFLAVVAAGAVTLPVAAAWGTAWAASPGNPFPTVPRPLPPRTVPIPVPPAEAPYDRARGAAGATSAGAGGWLPTVAQPACPPSYPYRPYDGIPGPRPATEGGRDRASAEAPVTGGSGGTAKSSATTAAAAPRPDGMPQPRPSSLGLQAGSTDDNAAFDDFLAYRDRFLATGIAAHDLDVTERHVLRVLDVGGRPVAGAKVEVFADDGTRVVDLRTYADGRTLFFPRLSSRPGSSGWRVRVAASGTEVEARLDPGVAGHTITLPPFPSAVVGQGGTVRLDVQFLLDTTGSMGDEIDRLRANMVSVSRQIAALPARPDVRFALTVYRDCGDAFVSRTYDFDGDVGRFTGELSTVVADGGGDYPEAVNQAVHDAVTRPGWRDMALKLVFVVADAPPHLDYPGDHDYAIDGLLAARRGIKLLPVASSGLDDQGEYVFRQLALLTTGRFVFLTYGADGVSPGDRTTHHVDGYETLALDQLVVRLVAEELAFQAPGAVVLPPLPTGSPRRTTTPPRPTVPPVPQPQAAPTAPRADPKTTAGLLELPTTKKAPATKATKKATRTTRRR